MLVDMLVSVAVVEMLVEKLPPPESMPGFEARNMVLSLFLRA
jgi:hypothetical protein